MKRLYLEIADTNEKRSTGMMYRDHLSANSGMLFDFGRKQAMSFWMKNTDIPLDIAFLNDDFKVVEVKSMAPHSTRSVRSSGNHRYALEVNAGWFDRNDIGVGSIIHTAKRVSMEEPLDNTLEQPERAVPYEETPQEGQPEQQQAPKPEVSVQMAFRDAIHLANSEDLAIAFTYQFPTGD